MTAQLDTEHLIHWKGRVVPWVTRWTGDVADRGVKTEFHPGTGRLRVRQPDGGLEFRDHAGVLWQREGFGRAGEPAFAQVNTYRQRASMLKRLCQICGRKINERPIQWLIPRHMLRHEDDPAGPTTMSTPTCAACIPLSLSLCPHLRRANDLTLARVVEYKPYGYFGALVVLDRDKSNPLGVRARIESHVLVPLSDLGAGPGKVHPGQLVAQQLAVQLTKFTLTDLNHDNVRVHPFGALTLIKEAP